MTTSIFDRPGAPVPAPVAPGPGPRVPVYVTCQACHCQEPREQVEPLTLDLAAKPGKFDTTMVYRCLDARECLQCAKIRKIGAYAEVAA